MKKLGIIFVTAALAAQAAVCYAAADEQQISVNVTIGKEGALAVSGEDVSVKDLDGDGKYTIDEALKAVHEKFYEGGLDGYATATADWGLSVKTLWGVTNGGSYGYAVNDVLSNGLSDTLNDGDYLSAYVYQDAATFTDHYAYFDVHKLSDVKQGDSVTLKLTEIAYKPDWTQELKPVPNATITIDGTETAFKTDENGSVSVKLEKSGEQIISFTGVDHPLAPAVVRANVTAAVPSDAPAETTQPAAETTAAPETTAEAVTSADAATTAAAATTSAAAATTAATAAKNGSTTKAAAAATGDTTALPAVAVTMLAAFGTALAMRRRTDK